MRILGSTLPKIANEKAGIIKPNIPVIISQTQAEVESVFKEKAAQEKAPILFADQEPWSTDQYDLDLKGKYQTKNIKGVLAVLDQLKRKGWNITDESTQKGLSRVVLNTGFKGRWQVLGENPLTIAEVAHNEAGFKSAGEQLNSMDYKALHLVLGFSRGKDILKMIRLLPKADSYTFAQAQKSARALTAYEIQEIIGESIPETQYIAGINEAIASVKNQASPDDLIFIGGSIYLVSEIEGL